MVTNIDVAVLTKLNALAAQHGIKPYEFVATIKRTQLTPDSEPLARLAVELVSPSARAKLETMLTGLGFRADSKSAVANEHDYETTGYGMQGGDKEIITAIDQAMSKAPPARSPRR